LQLTHGEHGDNKLLRGEEPLISGKFSFEIQRAPVSLQSKAKRKEEFKEVVLKNQRDFDTNLRGLNIEKLADVRRQLSSYRDRDAHH
jgi:hypothetical protein